MRFGTDTDITGHESAPKKDGIHTKGAEYHKMNERNNSNVTRLTHNGKEIILIGTAHVSRESVELTENVIREEKPDTVAVELCPSRYQAIKQKDAWQNMDIVKVIKEKKAFLLLSNLILSSFQKRIGKKLEIKPGQEMISAISAAEEIEARVHLADRDIRTTLGRTWRTMSFWSKIKVLFQMLLSFSSFEEISEEDVEKLKQEDVLESVLNEVGKSLPEVRSILIDERDKYLSEKIKSAPGEKVVAVVGAGHVPGIKKYWNQNIDITELDKMPPPKKTTKILQWVIPIMIMGLIAYGFYAGGVKAGGKMVMWWVLANGVLAGLGALAAFAHPYTIFSSIVAAPLTSLNPMIAAGWVSGLVEAFSRKPRVMDFESLADDISSISGFWRNKITRILLVVVFTNIGSSIGTFVAIPLMAKWV